jgi:hypothetical protein
MSGPGPRFFCGDCVELVDPVPGRKALRPGLVGEVVIGDERDAPLGLLSVMFPCYARPWQLRRQHLRHCHHGRQPSALDEE